MRPLRSALRIPLTALLASCILLSSGCRNRKRDAASIVSELSPPKGAELWESRYAVAFDDSYTPTDVHLQGRAPNDVLDQQLFQARLGHAAVVVLVRIEQVWGKGRYQGKQDQFLELQVGEVLMGSLPKEAPERFMVEVSSIDELPGELRGEIMLFFLRWDEDSDPPYHHHLMPADEDLVALIKAMVKHAQSEGVLDAKGDEKKTGRRGKRNRKKKKKGSSTSGDFDESMIGVGEMGAPPNTGGADDSSPGAAPVEGDGTVPVMGPDEPPPAQGPQPDASTGLQDLGGAGAAEPDGSGEPGDTGASEAGASGD